MNSPFANTFLALQNRITSQVTEVTYVDQDFGQLDEATPPVSWPCMLIDFGSFTFTDLGSLVQHADGAVTLTLAFKPTTTSSSGTPVEYIESALQYYDIEWRLQQAIQGWAPGSNYGALSRTAAATVAKNGIRVRAITYSLAFQDYSARETTTFISATPVISEVVV